MTDNLLTEKDLDLIDDDEPAPADGGGDKPADPAAKAEDKPAAEKGSGSVFDDDDDGDGEKKPDAAAEKKTGDESLDKDKKAEDSKDAEQKQAEEKEAKEWREAIADRALAKLKDTLPAGKFEKRRTALLNELKRSQSLEDLALRGIQAQEKLRSGDHKKPPKDADPELLAAWRKEHDVPASPEKYEIPTVPGHQWTDKDQPAIDSFREAAFEANAPQSVVNKLIAWKVRQDEADQADAQAKLIAVDREDKESFRDQLRAEFGSAEFKAHMALYERLLGDEDVISADAKDRFISARWMDPETGQWRRLSSDPDIARLFIRTALYEYGDGAMPGSGDGGAGANRVKELETLMKTNYDEYIRSGGADELLKLRQAEEAKAERRGRR